MNNKYDLIIAAEKQFAREVTLGVVVQQPLSVWHYLIPGMFIIDFLRRTSAVSRYTKHFIFPRQLAIDAAQHLLQGYERSDVSSRLADDIETWLNSLHLNSPQLALAQQRAVDLLIAHYSKLLSAEGNTYLELIENAYGSPKAYETYVGELTSAEAEIDRAIVETMGNNEKLKEKLQLEAQQVALRRTRILESLF
jgi:hypothetical protein